MLSKYKILQNPRAGNRRIILNSFAIQIIKRIRELNPTPKEFLFEENGERIKIRGFQRSIEANL